MAPRYAAIVLAGGAGRRLGGADKPSLVVNGQPMLHHVLDAVADAEVRIIVGPQRRDLAPDVLITSEEPAGGGPVAATAAGLAVLAARPGGAPEVIALLAADLPWLTREAVTRLVSTLEPGAADGTVFVDDAGRRQLLCGAWRRGSLARRLAAIGEPAGNPAGVSMRALVSGLAVVEMTSEDPAWFDCDTDDDLRTARERWRS